MCSSFDHDNLKDQQYKNEKNAYVAIENQKSWKNRHYNTTDTQKKKTKKTSTVHNIENIWVTNSNKKAGVNLIFLHIEIDFASIHLHINYLNYSQNICLT